MPRNGLLWAAGGSSARGRQKIPLRAACNYAFDEGSVKKEKKANISHFPRSGGEMAFRRRGLGAKKIRQIQSNSRGKRRKSCKGINDCSRAEQCCTRLPKLERESLPKCSNIRHRLLCCTCLPMPFSYTHRMTGRGVHLLERRRRGGTMHPLRSNTEARKDFSPPPSLKGMSTFGKRPFRPKGEAAHNNNTAFLSSPSSLPL